jgi:hypothetical protein
MTFWCPRFIICLRDAIRKQRRVEMSDFEKFGLICEEWLDAAKEDITGEEEDN